MDALTVLNDLRVATPCPASWDAMRGDDRVRYCDACSKSVYNISGLTAAEATDLLASAEGRLCARLYRRADGTLLTADCPVGLRYALRRRLVRMATAGMLLALAVRAGVWYCVSRERSGSIPAIPSGPGVTFRDWADWAAMAVGLRPDTTVCRPGITMGDVY